MATKRTPLHREQSRRITPHAVELFKAMEALKCICPPIDWSGPETHLKRRTCAGCERYWELNRELCDELQLKPWHWPAYEHPDATSPYPPDCEATRLWKLRREQERAPFEMFEALRQAANN